MFQCDLNTLRGRTAFFTFTKTEKADVEIYICPCSYREKRCKIQIHTIMFNDSMRSPFLSAEDTLFFLFLTELCSIQSFHSVFFLRIFVKLFDGIKAHDLKSLSHWLSVLSTKFQLNIKPELKLKAVKRDTYCTFLQQNHLSIQPHSHSKSANKWSKSQI